MTSMVRPAAWYGRSERRAGAIWIPSMRTTTGELDRLQPSTSVPAITAPRRSVNLKLMARPSPSCDGVGLSARANMGDAAELGRDRGHTCEGLRRRGAALPRDPLRE